MTAPSPTDDELMAAAQDLSSPLREDREKAEATLFKGKARSVPALVAALDGPPPPFGEKQVGRIALLLGAFQDRAGLDALLREARNEALADDDRAFVARAIAELVDGRDAFDDRVRDGVELLAKSADRYTRAFAAKAFGAMGDERSRARVQALTQDDDPWVRDQADAVLRSLATEAVAADAPTLDDFAALAADAQAQGGRLKPYLDDLDDHRRAVRDAAAVALVKAGQEAVPFLIDALNQPKARPRIGAALALGRLQSPDAAGPLLIAATTPPQTDDERELVPVALRSLANCLTGLEDGVAESLIPLTRSDDRFVRSGALLCLGRLADRRGIRAVVDALKDPDPFVVESASIALSEGTREEDTDIVLPLLEAFDVRRKKVVSALHEAILIALTRIDIDAPALRVRVRHRVRHEIRGPTAATRKAAVALLERLFTHDDPPSIPVVDEVLARLRDDHPEVRVVAASFLAQHLPAGFSGAADRLAEAVLRGERTLSLLSLEALRRHDTAKARSVLESVTAHDDSAVAQRAAELVDGLVPQTKEWAPSATPLKREAAEKLDPLPATTPSRVKPVAKAEDGSAPQKSETPVVEAKVVDAPVVEAKDPPPGNGGGDGAAAERDASSPDDDDVPPAPRKGANIAISDAPFRGEIVGE